MSMGKTLYVLIRVLNLQVLAIKVFHVFQYFLQRFYMLYAYNVYF